jgi:uncharacterized Fe-S cluster protein YjdI
MKKVYKEYTNGEIIVEWRSELCNHSGICITELPSVFDVLDRPWINMKGASTEEIIATVEACPTRALAWRYTDKPKEQEQEEQEEQGEALVVLVADGPIVVKGKLKIKHEDGSVETHDRPVSLCRCGLSEKMPFCDGAHFKGKEERL